MCATCIYRWFYSRMDGWIWPWDGVGNESGRGVVVRVSLLFSLEGTPFRPPTLHPAPRIFWCSLAPRSRKRCHAVGAKAIKGSNAFRWQDRGHPSLLVRFHRSLHASYLRLREKDGIFLGCHRLIHASSSCCDISELQENNSKLEERVRGCGVNPKLTAYTPINTDSKERGWIVIINKCSISLMCAHFMSLSAVLRALKTPTSNMRIIAQRRDAPSDPLRVSDLSPGRSRIGSHRYSLHSDRLFPSHKEQYQSTITS